MLKAFDRWLAAFSSLAYRRALSWCNSTQLAKDDRQRKVMMIFNLFWEIHQGNCSSIVYHNMKWHLTGGSPTSQEKVWVNGTSLRPLLGLFSNLGVLSASYYPCLIKNLSLVAGIIMIYMQGYACVTWKRGRGVSEGESVSVCVWFPQSNAVSRFSLYGLNTLATMYFHLCVNKGESVWMIHLSMCVCVSVTSPSICPPSLKSLVHLVTFWETVPANI